MPVGRCSWIERHLGRLAPQTPTYNPICGDTKLGPKSHDQGDVAASAATAADRDDYTDEHEDGDRR